MAIVIVPNELTDAINKSLDAAFVTCPDAERDRGALYHQILIFYNENGFVPEFNIEKRDEEPVPA